MEFNTKLSKLIARRKVIETRKRLNKVVLEILLKNIINTMKILMLLLMIKVKLY